MPTISMFFGIVIYMYFYDNKKHKLPHFHASFGEDDAVFSIVDGEVIRRKHAQKQTETSSGVD